MSRTTLSGMATAFVALIAASGAVAGAKARPRSKADHGTAAVATTPQTSGTTQYVAGFDSDAILGHAAVTYVIKAIPTSAKGTFSLVAHKVDLYTGTGELTGTATAMLTASAGGLATVTSGLLSLNTVGARSPATNSVQPSPAPADSAADTRSPTTAPTGKRPRRCLTPPPPRRRRRYATSSANFLRRVPA